MADIFKSWLQAVWPHQGTFVYEELCPAKILGLFLKSVYQRMTMRTHLV